MYDFAENLQERARLRHDRNVEAVGIFISPGAPMRLDYTRKKTCWRVGRRVLDCPAINQIPAAGQHQGSTSALRTATNALVAN